MKFSVPMMVVMLSASILFAHPPQSITLDYNNEDHVLTVTVVHRVNNPERHYIKQIIVELNNKEIIQQVFKRQTNEEGQKVMYVIVDANEGDTIAVTAYCSIAGKKKEILDVAVEKQ